jgi:hypothetical protein
MGSGQGRVENCKRFHFHFGKLAAVPQEDPRDGIRNQQTRDDL